MKRSRVGAPAGLVRALLTRCVCSQVVTLDTLLTLRPALKTPSCLVPTRTTTRAGGTSTPSRTQGNTTARIQPRRRWTTAHRWAKSPRLAHTHNQRLGPVLTRAPPSWCRCSRCRRCTRPTPRGTTPRQDTTQQQAVNDRHVFSFILMTIDLVVCHRWHQTTRERQKTQTHTSKTEQHGVSFLRVAVKLYNHLAVKPL